MKVLFISNYLNGHQTEFCYYMYNSDGIEFAFLQTEPMDEERVKLGWKLEEGFFPYLKVYDRNKESKTLIETADVLILGDSKVNILRYSLKKDVLILFYRERLFKKKYRFEFIRYIELWVKYAYRYRNYKTAVLCASAYTAADFHKIKAFSDRKYKWGYFPEFINYDIEKVIEKKYENSTMKILWIGRMIDWKRCIDILDVAKRLKENNKRFELEIVGTGPLETELKDYVSANNLTDCVVFYGSRPQKEVRKFMERAKIFVATSNHEEGWGAVINEAMNSACAVIGSHAMGSVPFMIENGKNGLIYKCGDIDDLYRNIIKCITDSERAKVLGRNAYNTVKDVWNAQNASKKLIALIKNIRNEDGDVLEDSGPCSKAFIVQDDWFKGEI